MIKRYVALVDPLKVGLQMLAYVSVKLEKKGQMPAEEFKSAVNTWSEVTECYSMTGDMDYLLRVQVEDLDHFSRFIMGKLLKQAARGRRQIELRARAGQGDHGTAVAPLTPRPRVLRGLCRPAGQAGSFNS